MSAFENPEDALKFFSERKAAYELAFNGPGGPGVTADLASFCRADETCVVPGDRDRTQVLEGRREVWLRIRDHLRLTAKDLTALYTRPATGATSHATRSSDNDGG